MEQSQGQLDLHYFLSFGALFTLMSEPGLVHHWWGKGYFSRTSASVLAHMEHQFCAEGNGVGAAISEVDRKMSEIYEDAVAFNV
jgi:hypothetical protein